MTTYVRFVFLTEDTDNGALLAALDIVGLKRGEDFIVTQSRTEAMRVATRSLRPAVIFTCLSKNGLRPDDCMKLAEDAGRSVMTIGYDDKRPSIEMRHMLDGWMKPEPESDYVPIQAFLHTYLAGVPSDQLLLGLRV